jgi:flagellar basal body-associated protein FliL
MMAETPLNPNEAAGTPSDPPVKAGKAGILGKLKVIAFVVVIIGLECGLAYLYLPTASQTAAMAGVTPNAELEVKPAEPEVKEKEEEAVSDQVEVDMGEFSVTAFQPVSNTTLRIDFHMFGTVAAANKNDFTKLMEENKHRFRDQILVTVRSAEITDLTDAGLGLIKRKILDKTNRIFGKPMLQTVIFSDFSFVEQ